MLNIMIAHTTPTGNILEAGHLALRDRMSAPNGVCYRGVPL